MNNLQLIKEKVIATQPEIMKLKFGCRIVNKYRVDKSVSFFVSKAGDLYRTFHEDFGYEDCAASNFEEILGRPIRLADVLLAIKNKTGYDDGVLVGCGGDFFLLEGDDYLPRPKIIWDLKKDNLEEQSEETLRFFAEILK